jgi:hypothetical protein
MRHSALELILTSILLFGVTTIVRFAVGPSPISRAFPQIHAELLIVGAGVGLLLSASLKVRSARSAADTESRDIAGHVAIWCVSGQNTPPSQRSWSVQYSAWWPLGRFGGNA